MLAGSNNTDLSRKYPNLDSKVIPFFQIWKELVNPQTLDIYQYRVLTSYSALVELTSVIEKTQSGLFTTDANTKSENNNTACSTHKVNNRISLGAKRLNCHIGHKGNRRRTEGCH